MEENEVGKKWVHASQAEDHGAEELVPVLDVGVGEEEAQEDDGNHEQDGHDREVQKLGMPGKNEYVYFEIKAKDL